MPQGKGGLLGLLTTRAWYVYFKFDSLFIVHLVFSFFDFSVHSLMPSSTHMVVSL